MQDVKNNPLLNDLAKALKKDRSKVTNADINNAYPNKNHYGKWILDIKYAKGTFDDDEEKVFNVFRSLASQLEIANFANLYKATQKVDLYTYLESFLSSGEMQTIYQIVKNKKKV
jgi:hypothetical protein